MEKERSKSTHLFEKESVFKKTLRNAHNDTQHKLPALPVPTFVQNIIFQNKEEEIPDSVPKEKPIPKPPIKDLRQDLLCIPKNYLDDPPNSNLNSSFVSFNELHRKQPTLFPVLNYVSTKQVQAEEEKKKKEENMSAIDRFFKDMIRDSQRVSVAVSKPSNFSEFSQIIKELNHNHSQKKMYENVMDKINLTSNESILIKYQHAHIKMPLVRIYSTENEKFERMKKNAILKKGKTMVKDPNYAINYMDLYSNSKISIYKYENTYGLKPLAREGATLSVIEDRAYLIGGRGINFQTEVSCFKLDKKKWKFFKPITSSPSKDKGIFTRSNHSAVVYKNSVVVYGGEKEYNLNMKARQCLSGVEIYHIENNEWNTLYCKGDIPEARKNHLAVLIGSHILIHGGINSFSKCLKDAIILDLLKTQWINCEDILDLPALNGHTAVFVVENEKKYSSLFFPRQNNSYSLIKEEGVYIFGGKNANNKANNNLTVIKPGITPFKVIKMDLKGTPPSPRYNHAMKFFKYLNCLIIYGGRNDEMNCCFSDIFALNLESLIWTRLNNFDNKYNECKCSFASDLYKTRMLIFGGINFNGFIDNDLYVVEFDDSGQKKRSLEQKIELTSKITPQKIQRRVYDVKTFLPVPAITDNNSP